MLRKLALSIIIAVTVAMVPSVAPAHTGSLLDRTDSTARHVLLRVELKAEPDGEVHAECFARNDGGSHDHSHRITACQVRRGSDGATIKVGGCDTAGSYGPCGYSMENQHVHSASAPPIFLPDCYFAIGGFDVVGHSHATHQTDCFGIGSATAGTYVVEVAVPVSATNAPNAFNGQPRVF